MMTQTDRELLTRIREGEISAFTLLYDKYRRRLFAYCFRMIPNRSNAEEIVQTTFIKAYTSLKTLENADVFYNWLFSIARNEIYTFLRYKQADDATCSIEDNDIMSCGETPIEVLVREEERELLQGSINQMRLEYREVLILRHYEKLSYVEIAAITGETVSSVESRLFKARKALAKKVGPYLK
jgi:RNA polymerase sigma-70 factor, ECF subfamily